MTWDEYIKNLKSQAPDRKILFGIPLDILLKGMCAWQLSFVEVARTPELPSDSNEYFFYVWDRVVLNKDKWNVLIDDAPNFLLIKLMLAKAIYPDGTYSEFLFDRIQADFEAKKILKG